MKKILIRKDEKDEKNILGCDYLEVGIRISEALQEAKSEKENDFGE
ncbi:MAG: hypothetical protein LKJ13_09375 [Clostridia bacterium]|nr:hypothetical protein [Clostridia bacterium]MCI1959376.1 hypothetical protein [Clostridia bacterium]MCI2000007.1 hypothetical protein [Clostridia bacterium]MCI2014459.1 hypothetical protein [Clostridia bacterium]